MIIEISVAGFRQNLGVMFNQVQYRHDSAVINKDGKAVAARVNVRLFERIRRMQGRFDELCQRIEAGLAGMPEGQGLDEIDATLALDRVQARQSARKRRVAVPPAPTSEGRLTVNQIEDDPYRLLSPIFCALGRIRYTKIVIAFIIRLLDNCFSQIRNWSRIGQSCCGRIE